MSDRFKSFIDFDLLMPSDRVVLGWAQFANEAGLPVWIHWSCVVVNVYTVHKKRERNVKNGNFGSKLPFCVGVTGRIELVGN